MFLIFMSAFKILTKFFYYYTLSSGIHVQNLQICYIGIHMPWWFAASIPLSPKLSISLNVIPLQSPHPLLWLCSPPNRAQYMMFPPPCPCVLIVQHSFMSENMWCLVFCSCVSLLRMMISSFIHAPAKDMNSSFFMAA